MDGLGPWTLDLRAVATKRRPSSDHRRRGQPLHCLRVGVMFFDQDAGGESVSSVSFSSTGTARWTMMGPASSSAVTRCTVTPLTLTPCARACRCAWRPGNEGSNDGWMFTIRFGKRRDEAGTDPAHESCQADDVDRVRAQLVDERAVVVVARGPAAMIEDGRLDAGLAGAIEAAGAGDVRDDDGNRGVEPSVGDGVDERLQVAAAARDQDAEPPGLARSSRQRRAAGVRDGGPVARDDLADDARVAAAAGRRARPSRDRPWRPTSR